MSVLINGMEMPKNCGSCPLRRINENRVWCYKTGEYIDFNKEFDGRKNNCPLIKIPTPHGRLIDADELANKTFYNPISAPYITYKTFCNASTVIEAEGET